MPIETAPSIGGGPPPPVFTEYVTSLRSSGEAPDRESFDRVWRALKIALRAELRRRGLWLSPPRYLGVVGADVWSQEALDELVVDAYVFNFVDRLRSLRAQLEVKPNVEGLVRLNLRNFLYERQRRHDPLGCRLFETLRDALAGLVERGELEVTGGDPGIRNDTILRFRERLSAREGSVSASSPAPTLQELTGTWSDELVSDLVTARGSRRAAVAEDLGRKIGRLRMQGHRGFVVKDLVDPLKNAVRERWRALHVAGEPDEGGADTDELFGEARRRYRPDEAVEDTEAFEKLTGCVELELRRLDTDERSGEYLNVLWQFLRLHAAGERDLPSRRKLAERLGIPRNRFPELYETLGTLLERCRKLLFEPPADRKGGTP